jgi:hypothetical protein
MATLICGLVVVAVGGWVGVGIAKLIVAAIDLATGGAGDLDDEAAE